MGAFPGKVWDHTRLSHHELRRLPPACEHNITLPLQDINTPTTSTHQLTSRTTQGFRRGTSATYKEGRVVACNTEQLRTMSHYVPAEQPQLGNLLGAVERGGRDGTSSGWRRWSRPTSRTWLAELREQSSPRASERPRTTPRPKARWCARMAPDSVGALPPCCSSPFGGWSWSSRSGAWTRTLARNLKFASCGHPIRPLPQEPLHRSK